MAVNKEIFNRYIQAVLPVYDENGSNVCKVIFEDGEEEIQDVKIDTFINNWFKEYLMDLRASKARSKKILSIGKIIPLIINSDLVLVPIKCRKVIGENDGSYGYIRYQEVEDKSDSILLLESNIEVPYLTSFETVRNKLSAAYVLICAYEKEIVAKDRINNKKKKIRRLLDLEYY